ncbi:MAG: pyridoxamine 5'-phosphate oxidase family protein [Planctomycetota bacterium]|nr:pyridoxamine 5'-phosphate oxidase family protein [Planctomycetota bacterium]
MSIDQFKRIVTSADELTELLGSPSESGVKKQLSELDDHMKSFIAASPFLLLGTVSRDGRCDVSPRGDLPDVGKVLDSRTLVIPDWKGNRRVDSLRNIIETGRVGLLFLTPGLGETLRVNGRACVIRDDDVLASMSKLGKQPLLGIGVEVEECFFQCAKALIRSTLWEWSAEHSDPPPFDFAEILVDQTKIKGLEVEPLRQQIEESYKDRLW